MEKLILESLDSMT